MCVEGGGAGRGIVAPAQGRWVRMEAQRQQQRLQQPFVARLELRQHAVLHQGEDLLGGSGWVGMVGGREGGTEGGSE